MTNEMARAISMCIVCGDDIVNNRCQCSDFADWQAGRIPNTIGPILYLATGNAEGEQIVCPLVYSGAIQVGERRVPVLEVALGARERLVTHSKESYEFRLWDSADARDEDQGSASANPDRTQVH